jgi:hypothetical protein
MPRPRSPCRSGANDPICDIGWIEMPQRTGLVP